MHRCFTCTAACAHQRQQKMFKSRPIGNIAGVRYGHASMLHTPPSMRPSEATKKMFKSRPIGNIAGVRHCYYAIHGMRRCFTCTAPCAHQRQQKKCLSPDRWAISQGCVIANMPSLACADVSHSSMAEGLPAIIHKYSALVFDFILSFAVHDGRTTAD